MGRENERERERPEKITVQCWLSVLAVVNVGVSGLATKLTLECVAHNCGYTREDVDGKCPPDSV